MYLSRVEIDSLNRQKIKDLSHLGAYHHWVESCFPDELQKDSGYGIYGGLTPYGVKTIYCSLVRKNLTWSCYISMVF